RSYDLEVTPLALKRAAIPPVNWLMIAFLRAIISDTLIDTSPVVIPCTLKASFASWYLYELSSNAFEGMHPTFKQVPPFTSLPSALRHFSIQAVFKPNCAARIAAT